MAIVSEQKNGWERVQVATGKYSDDAASPAAAVIETGFRPRYVEVVDSTTGVLLEWYDGLGNGAAIKTTNAGARSKVSSGGITVEDRGFSFPVVQNSQYFWRAMS